MNDWQHKARFVSLLHFDTKYFHSLFKKSIKKKRGHHHQVEDINFLRQLGKKEQVFRCPLYYHNICY